ncbi:hypothetical protein EJ05DRAFT_503727 [Pseudovirgaria hyperparasitica]|uniref:Rhodopsin domain-containing protein n=1 Tax=Pseudovirgaria hyperparasitica TaxID=470096 RepID=A0A6A6VYN1_9PEZI|nr:uncharacterized protein EJ05DRAFT_503727 [Pseudovirgaria hyperparasitica]KAF2754780.1 hypothetical protein EJ05DRAFT_503727 [Pseudovirgaria hyperparasitica]
MDHSEPPTVLVIAGHPADIGWAALGPAIGCVGLTLVAVGARWYTRWCITRVIGLDDYMIVFSTILAIALTGVVAAEVHLGIGESQWADNHARIPTMAKLIIASNVIYQIVVNVTKASIVTQYLRIFSSTPVIIFRRTCQAVLIVLTLIPIWGVFGSVFLSPINVILDLVVWLLPMPLVSQLKLPRRQKIGLMVLFTLGGMVCIIGILRVVMVDVAAKVWHDLTQANVGIAFACLLSIKPLVAKLFPHLVESDSTPAHSMRLRKISFWGQPLSETMNTSTSSQLRVDSKTASSVTKPARAKKSWSSMRMHSQNIFGHINWETHDRQSET